MLVPREASHYVTLAVPKPKGSQKTAYAVADIVCHSYLKQNAIHCK